MTREEIKEWRKSNGHPMQHIIQGDSDKIDWLIAEVERLQESVTGFASCNRARQAAEEECERLREGNREASEYFNQHELAWGELHKNGIDLAGMDLPTAISWVVYRKIKDAAKRCAEICDENSYDYAKDGAEICGAEIRKEFGI